MKQFLFPIGLMIVFWSAYFIIGCFIPRIPQQLTWDKAIDWQANAYELGQLTTCREYNLKCDYKKIQERTAEFKKTIKKIQK